MGRVRFWFVLVVTVLLMLELVIAATAWRSPPLYAGYDVRPLPVPIMTMNGYGKVIAEHPRPYVVEAQGHGGAALLYGAEHVRDPSHPQNEDITARFRAFAPTAVLVEGRLGFLMPGFMDPVKQYGEGGLVFGLARGAQVPVWSWEPSRDAELAFMLERWSARDVALLSILRPYFSGLRHGRPDDPAAFVEPYLERRTAWAGLEDTFASVDDLDAYWTRRFPEGPDWRDVDDRRGLPGYLAEMGAEGNAVRDEHLAQVILDLVHRGHRVFAVMGSSHAVKLDAAVRAALGATTTGAD